MKSRNPPAAGLKPADYRVREKIVKEFPPGDVSPSERCGEAKNGLLALPPRPA
jgi:hypothetical protein